MQLERSGGTNLVEVLDRVLDKGIVIDAVVRVSIVGFEIISLEARVVVASVETYLKYSQAFMPADSRPVLDVTPAPAGMLPAASTPDASLSRRSGQKVAA
jgi:gas vesicle structural protein